MLDHVAEDRLLIEPDLAGLALGHVSQVSHQTDDVRRVVLHVGILVGTDYVVVALGVRAGGVEESVRVDRVRQDVVIVDGSEATFLLVRLCEDQLEEVLG